MVIGNHGKGTADWFEKGDTIIFLDQVATVLDYERNWGDRNVTLTLGIYEVPEEDCGSQETGWDVVLREQVITVPGSTKYTLLQTHTTVITAEEAERKHG